MSKSIPVKCPNCGEERLADVELYPPSQFTYYCFKCLSKLSFDGIVIEVKKEQKDNPEEKVS